MKKTVSALLCFVLVLSLSAVLVSCGKPVTAENYALFSDNGYINYAEQADVNTEKYPVLSDQGMKLVIGYNEDSSPIEGNADDSEVIKNNFDPTLPTLIIVHGVQLGGGRYGVVHYYSENLSENIEMTTIFKNGENINNQHWNVMYFHYERFADSVVATTDAGAVEARVWTRGADGLGSKFAKSDGTESEADALPYSLAEFFAAEYIRTFKTICQEFSSYLNEHAEIRTASHSMGGCLTVATMSLVTILSDAGQLDRKLLPNRMELLDSFVGTTTVSDKTIAWSGKRYIKGSPRLNYVNSLENIVSKNIVVTLYYNQLGWVPFLNMLEEPKEMQEKMNICAERILSLVTTVLIYPDYKNVGVVSIDGHNAIREWYFLSYQTGPIDYYDKDDFIYDEQEEKYSLKDGAISLGKISSASATNEQILALKGKEVQMQKTWINAVYATIEVNDDLFWLKEE